MNEGDGYADKLAEAFDKALLEFGNKRLAKALYSEGWDG